MFIPHMCDVTSCFKEHQFLLHTQAMIQKHFDLLLKMFLIKLSSSSSLSNDKKEDFI